MKNIFTILSKSLTLFFLISIYLSCHEEKKFGDNYKYSIETDSTYTHWRDSIALHETIVREEFLELPAVDKWDDIVRLRGQDSGWGTFDYICSIYNDENKRIQLIKQNRFSTNPVSYSYRERILTEEEYNKIMELIDTSGIYEMPFDLEPNRNRIDGGEYTIAIKKKDFTKVVFWQEGWESETEEKKRAINVFKNILRQANYPLPAKGYLVKEEEKKGVISYKIYVEDYEVIMDYYATYQGTRLPSWEGSPIINIAAKDTASIKSNVKIICILGFGDSIEINNIEIDNDL